MAGCTMGYVKCSTMALPVLFQKTVDENAEKTRKAIDAEERGAPTP